MINIPGHSQTFIFLIFGILVLATVSRLFLQWKKPQKDFTELRQRIQSWWWMVALLIGVLWFGSHIAVYSVAFLSFLALKEFLSITPIRQVDRNAVFWLYIAIPIHYYWVAEGWYGMFIIFIPVYIFLFTQIRLVLARKTEGFIRAAGLLHLAVMLTVFCLSHLAYLFMLPVKNEAAGSSGLVLFLLFMTQFNDVSQYIWGKTLGKRKIIPEVSPNKTWAGFLGGVLTITCTGAFLGPYLTPLTQTQGVIAGLIISIVGFFGDTVISCVKRDLNIKDTGNLIPGHGGLLDRLDSVIFTAPLFFHYLYYLHF